MNPHMIIANLKIKGSSQRQIADLLNVHPSAVNLVIHSNGESYRIKKAISAVINLPIKEIWPKKEKASEAATSKA